MFHSIVTSKLMLIVFINLNNINPQSITMCKDIKRKYERNKSLPISNTKPDLVIFRRHPQETLRAHSNSLNVICSGMTRLNISYYVCMGI